MPNFPDLSSSLIFLISYAALLIFLPKYFQLNDTKGLKDFKIKILILFPITLFSLNQSDKNNNSYLLITALVLSATLFFFLLFKYFKTFSNFKSELSSSISILQTFLNNPIPSRFFIIFNGKFYPIMIVFLSPIYLFFLLNTLNFFFQ
jgi:hypothetical protein